MSDRGAGMGGAGADRGTRQLMYASGALAAAAGRTSLMESFLHSYRTYTLTSASVLFLAKDEQAHCQNGR